MPGVPAPTTNWTGSGKKKKKSSGPSWLEKLMNPVMETALNPKKQFGSLAEMIEKQAASQQRQAESKAAGPGGFGDPFQSLQDQLFDAMNGINATPTPIEQLRQMATQQVNAQYNPMIDALNSEMGAKKKRGNASAGQAREMYGAMSKDFLAQLPELTQQFAAEDKATNARYDEAQGQMEGEYDKQAADQDAVLKRLGVQAASQEASQQSQDDQAYFQNQMESDQQQTMNALNEQQNAAETYQRDLGNNATMAGENTAQDILGQLEDYLTQAGSQMTGLKSQRGSAIEALLSQMQSQDSQNAETHRQSEIDNLMQMFNFQLAATKAGQSAAGQSGGSADSLFKGTSGLSGASNRLAQTYPDQPILAKNLMQQINDVLANKNVVNGKFQLDPGNESMGQSPKYSDVGQEYMMDLLRKEFDKEGGRYSSGDINNTMDALLAYMGKLR